jgi:hypothetical protein
MKKSKTNTKTYLTIGIVLGIIIISLIAFILLKPNIKITKKAVSYTIIDECGMAMGNLIHQVKDEGTCKIKCRAKCFSINADYIKIEFKEETKACNECKCYCDE